MGLAYSTVRHEAAIRVVLTLRKSREPPMPLGELILPPFFRHIEEKHSVVEKNNYFQIH